MRTAASTIMPAVVLGAAAAIAWQWRRWDGLALLALMFLTAVMLLRLGFWFVLKPLAAGRPGPGWEWAYGVGAVAALFGIAAGVWALRASLLAWQVAMPGPAVVLGAVLAAAGVGLGAWATWTLGWSRLVCVPILLGSPAGEPARLETSGPYALCRNPIYLAELLILAGALLGSGVMAVGVLLVGLAVTAAVVVPRERRELRARFGPPYEAYAARVAALLPRLWP